MSRSDPPSIVCPLPVGDRGKVLLAHGGGGRHTRDLLRDHVLPAVGAQAARHDAAILPGGLAMTTDAYVVRPLFFPGGDIGKLAVIGTANDLAMAGARLESLALSMILEEGLELALLDRVLASVRETADALGAIVVTGDTKVVERGRGDGVYLTTTGLGRRTTGAEIGPWRVRSGDAILVSGDIGRHGVAVLAARGTLGLHNVPDSDVEALWPAVEALLTAGVEVHALRDCTRGGLATVLHEIAADADLTLEVVERLLPIDPAVAAACELLGLEPMHMACEGRMVVFVPDEQANDALTALLAIGVSCGAAKIGRVITGPGEAWLRGAYGQERPIELPLGELLPRIC